MKIDLKTKKYFLLDLDGTIYAGSKLFPFTLKFLEKLHSSARQPIFLTNNSSRSTAEYLQKFAKMGIKCDKNEIYTSAQATIDYLLERDLKRIFLMATPGVEKEFKEAGLELIQGDGLLKPKNNVKSVPGHTLPQAVVLAFDTTFTYQKFCQAYDYIMAGVPFIATHPDKLLPLEGGKFHPDIGALISAFETALLSDPNAKIKSPTIIGKPNKTIYAQLQKKLAALSPNKRCRKSEMLMIGDRLYTDIKGANDFGIDTILVLSGETTAAMAKKSPIKATNIVKNISELLV